jgi:enoyl-CoA hydratase / 3-hydroxyacyl-CoA dehydrogenase
MEQATAQTSGKAAEKAAGSVVDRFSLKAFVEACLVLEEGVASLKDIETGMMMGAGLLPGPFVRADAAGLDQILESLERAEREWGEGFAPPTILRRLVAQGRLGQKSGQGFFPYPQPDSDFEQKETVLLETRGEVAVIWLNRPPANPMSPQLIQEFGALWKHCHESSQIRSVVIASSNVFTFSAGADIKEFTKMDASGGAGLLDSGHAMLREMETSSTATIAAVNSIAFGGGCELSMACDFRLAAESATFGQPEINLGIIPGFGGTQRLARLVGEGKALEMNLTGDAISAEEAYRVGLAHRVVPDHELFDTALNWARKLAGQAPIAIEQIKTVSAKGDLDQGIEAEKQGFAKVFGSDDAREGITAFLQKRKPKFQGK